ncbi:MAG: Glu/Leu/Phe/Val family dehydrogenase [Chloroflexota bacterium]
MKAIEGGPTMDIFDHADDLGPEKVLHFYDPGLRLRGVLVVDNTALGPALGGLRMLPDVTTDEVIRLARAMTLKNSAAGIPYGGGKGGIIADPRTANKDELIRAYAKFLRPHTDYIPGPDMGTNEHCMAIMYDEIGRAISLHQELGGIPLDEVGVTGYGVAEAAEAAASRINLNLAEATVAIEGFGAVGKAAFRALKDKGARVVGVSDVDGAIYDPAGLDYDRLLSIEPETCRVAKVWNRDYKDGQRLTCQELFPLDVDILIPGARPDVITVENVRNIRARLLVEAANIPASEEAERYLADSGVLVVPDFVANAGGVIAGAVELRKGTLDECFQTIRAKIHENVNAVLDRAAGEGLYPRQAAVQIARDRVLTAMRDKGRL